jgi:hypothetical protein
MNPLRILLAIVWATAAAVAQGVDADGPRTSPFRGMRLVEQRVEVQVHDDTWCELVSIDGLAAADLLARTRAIERQWWRRITEDLPAVFDALGQPLGTSAQIVVRDAASGDERDLGPVPLTEANRRRLVVANRARGNEPAPGDAAPAAPEAIRAVDARADLAQLRTLLDEQFAYRELRPVDLDRLLRDATTSLRGDTVPVVDLARAVDGVLRAFGDGHSRLDRALPEPGPFLPFLVQDVAGGPCAFRADRSELLDDGHPFVVALDGIAIERWLAAARARGTQGSPAMQRREAERGLRDLGALRLRLGVADAPQVRVTLRGANGALVEHAFDTAARRPLYGEWPRTRTRLLDGGIGYLRLPAMLGDAAFLDGIDTAMREFRGSKGLVVDVRGNGGGTRDALRRLAPYLLPADGAPRVGNVATVLRARGQPAAADALADRGLWPADWNGWSEPQRAAIAAAARGFRPSWRPPPARFSPWYWLVLDRADNANAYAYPAPVVVLIDRGCFSATDVFAAALGALPQVTLLGEATAGGSGRARRHRLGHSGLVVQLSTMASFQPDGTLFEGHGVLPDIAVEPQPTDAIGATDAMLQRAIEVLRR